IISGLLYAQMSPLNHSDFVDAEDVSRDENLAKVEIAPLSTVFISAALLNIALLLILWRQRMSRMRVFVCPQLMWDITDRFLGPDLVCRLVKYLQVLGMFSSIYMIVVITFDKYEAECNPMVKFQRTRTRLNIPLLGCHRFSFSHRSRLHPAMGLRTYITWTNMVIFCFTCYCTCRLPSAHLPSHPDQPVPKDSTRCGWHVQVIVLSLLAGATFVPCVLFGYTATCSLSTSPACSYTLSERRKRAEEKLYIKHSFCASVSVPGR
uniref:G-protein coupled receptors family 1 profile domain-containing protein n=1 Tax=Monopterus albus TaxID=43700 RepID=A0A3Q3QY74_MONAL